ncbi:MAG: hypothetical protein II333_02360 [Clostridia bacterium]|nr:hypothetical protein [Clostridia bacterium]
MYHDYNTIRVVYEVWRGNAPLKTIEAYGDPVLTQDTDSELKTSLKGTFFAYTGVNFLTDRLHVTIDLNGTVYPLGIFCVTTETPRRTDGLALADIEAYSLLYVLKQCKLENRLFYPKGTAYTAIVQELLADAGFTNYAVDSSDLTLSTDREDWEIGTEYLSIINGLLREMNYNDLWVTVSGQIRASAYTAPSLDSITHIYTAGRDSIIKENYTVTGDYYGKANVFIVICDHPELDETLRAESVNDSASSPYSTVNLGRRVPVIEYVDNTPSQAELQRYADNLKAKSHQTNEVIEFVTAIVPTHSAYDTVLVDVGGVTGVYRETGYEITLGASGEMKHTGARIIV